MPWKVKAGIHKGADFVETVVNLKPCVFSV